VHDVHRPGAAVREAGDMGGIIVQHADAPARDGASVPETRRDLQIDAVVAMLQADLGEMFPTEVLEERVRIAFTSFNDAPIRDFVPILVRTSVRRELRARR
jgi:hypothetical protein